MTNTVNCRLVGREVFTELPVTGSGIGATAGPRVVFDRSWSYESEAGVSIGDFDATINSLNVGAAACDVDKRQLFAVVDNFANNSTDYPLGTSFVVGSATGGGGSTYPVAVSYLWITTEIAASAAANSRTCYGAAATFGTWLYVEGELEDDLNVLPGGSSTVDPLSV